MLHQIGQLMSERRTLLLHTVMEPKFNNYVLFEKQKLTDNFENKIFSYTVQHV